MKILHVITMLDVGGAERLLVDLLPLLCDKGHRVDLLLFNGVETKLKEDITQYGIRIFELSHGKDVREYRKEVYNPFHVFKLKKFMHGYDIIHTHNSICQLYVAIAHFLNHSSTLLVTTEHCSNNRRRSRAWYKAIDKWMYNQYASIICIADGARLNLENYIGQKQNICTINNGVDIQRFIKPIKDISKQDKFVVIMVAGLRSEKDHGTLINALSLLPPNYHLQLVGGGVREKELKHLTQQLSLSERVTFTGPRLDVPDILEKSDIAVFSSHGEGFGLAAVEAMAAGRPMVASDVDGLHDVVGGAGILFPHGDSKALAQKIQWLCEHPSEYHDVAKRCQERAKHYDISIMAEKYCDLYESLVK